MENLTKETFKEKIFDFEAGEEWEFIGDKPTIIKFGTLWCGPCKTIAPILEELSVDYEDIVDIYDVDVDKQQELGSVFGIRSVPSILFIPINEQPQMSQGSMSKSDLERSIKDILNVKIS